MISTIMAIGSISTGLLLFILLLFPNFRKSDEYPGRKYMVGLLGLGMVTIGVLNLIFIRDGY